MNITKKAFFGFFALLFCSAAFAKNSMLSIQVIQNNPGQEKIWATSEFFEQSLIDYFFNKGRIVSNSPIFVDNGDSRERSKSLRAALIENKIGGMDYLVRVEVFFRTTNSSKPDSPKLGNIERVAWKVYDVFSGAELSDGSAEPGPITKSNDNEAGIIAFASKVASSAIGER